MFKTLTYALGVVCLVASIQVKVVAQDSASFKQKVKDQFKVSGSIGYSQILYSSLGAPSQRAPFFWQVQANLNIKVGIINMPFSARYNSQGADASYPTLPTQIGMSPKYKDYTFHIGWRSMNFSEYSLAGNQFVGGGVEYNPQNFWISYKLVYGRFQKSDIFYDENRVILGVPTFERWGYGAQINFGKAGRRVGLHAFRANDDPTSLVGSDTLGLTPNQNLVYGVTLDQKITKQIAMNGEMTWSALTTNTFIESDIQQAYSYLNNIGGLFSVNASTQLKKAALLNLTYSPEKYNLKLSYRRVDPDYKSLGAVFLNNDLEDLTANLGFGALQNKMNLALSGGLQRNNIDGEKVSRTLRSIGAIDLQYAPTEVWNIGLNYANFSTNTSMSLVVDGLDTLRYVQVTSSYGGNIMRLIKGEKINHSIMLLVSQQDAVTNDKRESQTLVASLSETMTLTKLKANVAMALSATQTTVSGSQTQMIGPTLSASKQLLKGKMAATTAVSYLSNLLNGDSNGNILNTRAGLNYNIGKHHNATFNVAYTSRMLAETTSELIANMAYTLSF